MKIDIEQLSFIDTRLRSIAIWLEQYTGIEFTVTSLYRTGNKGVHGTLPLRAIDLRFRGPESLGQAFADLVNLHWRYDETRPAMRCAIYHDAGSGPHLHLQVHPRTKYESN